MSQVVTNPTPKQRYASNPKVVSTHRDLIAMAEFQVAVDFALLQFESELAATPVDNFNLCAAAQLQRAGVQKFIHILRNLAETQGPVESKVAPGLNHRA